MIAPSNIFHTPDNFEQLYEWIERHPAEEHGPLYVAAGMAWNLACKLSNEPDSDAVELPEDLK